MNITILEKKKNRISFEIDADHTLCSVLKKELWNDNDVHVSGYYTEHIQTGKPRFILEAAEKEPVSVLLAAIKRLKKQNASFLEAFEEAK